MGFKKQWDYSGSFLEQFEPLARSTVANWFCQSVRNENCWDEEELLLLIQKRCRETGRYSRVGNALDDDGVALLESVLDTLEAFNFAEFIIWREALPEDEREKLKAKKGQVQLYQAMSDQPPTEKQLAYLRVLRCPVIPETKLEASELIGRYKK